MARQTLNSKFLDSVKTDKIQEDFWDTKVSGFGIRVTALGRKTWFLFYRFRDQKRRLTLGTYPALPLHEARQAALDTLRKIYAGDDPSQKRETYLFKDLAARYLAEHAKVQKRSWREDERILNKDLLPTFGDLPTDQISRKDVIILLDKISARGAKIQPNRTLALARKVFNFGIEKDLIEFNPCSNIKKPNKETSRDRVLSKDELSRIWNSFETLLPETKHLLKLILLSGQRSNEVKHMRWEDLNLRDKIWTIPGEYTKNGKTHRLPLTEEILTLIDLQKSNRFLSVWVFPSRTNKEKCFRSPQKAVERLRDFTEIDFVGHDFRRTAATTMASFGIPRLVISKLLNHSDSSITNVYDRHSYYDEKRKALEAWCNYLLTEVHGQRAVFKENAPN